MGRDHSEPCPRCGVYVGGLNETECDCVPDPFPNELVEAAAKALYEHFAFPHHGAIEQPWEEQTVEARETWYGQARAVLSTVLPLIEQRARLDERERLSSRVHENGWCPTCARDTDEAAMQRLAGKSLESLSRTDLVSLALRNLNAAMDAEARADSARREAFREVVEALRDQADMLDPSDCLPPEDHYPTFRGWQGAAQFIERSFLSPDNPEGNA